MPARTARDGKSVEVHPDLCPELVVERGPDNKGVGPWVPSTSTDCCRTTSMRPSMLGADGAIESSSIRSAVRAGLRSVGRHSPATADQSSRGARWTAPRRRSRACWSVTWSRRGPRPLKSGWYGFEPNAEAAAARPRRRSNGKFVLRMTSDGSHGVQELDGQSPGQTAATPRGRA